MNIFMKEPNYLMKIMTIRIELDKLEGLKKKEISRKEVVQNK